VITGVKFKDGVEVTKVDLVAAWFRCQNTTLGYNSKKGSSNERKIRLLFVM